MTATAAHVLVQTRVCDAWSCQDEAILSGLCAYHLGRSLIPHGGAMPGHQRLTLAGRAHAMRAGGATGTEIAGALGISRSYAYTLLSDPSGAKAREWKDRHRGTCIDCGGPTDGSNGSANAPERCRTCRALYERENKRWTREAVIEAIRLWAAEHDGEPPVATEWLTSIDDRGDRFPSAGSVYRSRSNPGAPFATWADAIEAAGFPRPYKGHKRAGIYERNGTRPGG